MAGVEEVSEDQARINRQFIELGRAMREGDDAETTRSAT